MNQHGTWFVGALMLCLGCGASSVPLLNGPAPLPPPQPPPPAGNTLGATSRVDAGAPSTGASRAVIPTDGRAEPASPLDALSRACEAGEARACLDAADAVVADQRGALEDHRRVLDRLSRSCASGGAVACNATVVVLLNGPAPLRDPTRARSITTEQCQRDNLDACGILGLIMDDGVGGPRDERGAIRFYERGCEGNYGLACNNLGAAYLEGSVVPRDMERARAMFQRACDGGYQRACTTLAQRFSPGGATAPDPTPAPEATHWSTTIESSTINGARFETVRGTCNPFEVLAALAAVGRDARRCARGGAPARVSFTLASGEVTAARNASNNAGGECLTRAVRHARFGGLTCGLEFSVRR